MNHSRRIPAALAIACACLAPAPPVPADPAACGTFEQLAAWTRARHPRLQLETDGIPLEVWREILGEWDGLCRDFPELEHVRWFSTHCRYKGRPDYLWSRPGYGTTVAMTCGDEPLRVFWNPDTCRSVASMRASTARDIRQGWHPKGGESLGARYYAIHEAAHVLTYRLRATDPARHDLLLKLPDALAAGDVSKYATHTAAEAVAEAFLAARVQPEKDWAELTRAVALLLKMPRR